MPNLPISQLPLASALNGTEVLPLVQGGVTTQAIVQDILDANLSLTSSGITLSGDIVPATPQGANLGSLTQPFREIYLQSGSINIESDIPGGIRASISNEDGNVTIEAAGFQLKSGSFIPFEISETARTIIRVPNIPAGDIGAFSIIGNPSGSYQPVINPSGMIHITSNDNQAARVTVDGFGTNIGAIFAGRQARGTATTPTPTLSGDVLVRLAGLGYATSSYFPVVGATPTSLEFQATENYSTSSYGSRAAFYTYANGAVSRSLVATIDTTGLFVSGAFSASLQQNYVWLGNSSNRSVAVPLATLAISGGFYTTGSFGFYGAFCSTGSQTNPIPNVSRSMQLETTELSDGVSIVSGSRITVAHPGVYNLQFSAQLEKTDNGVDTVYIWFKKNGTNIPRSTTSIDVLKQAGGSGRFVAAWNYVENLVANDYIEIIWQSDDINMQLVFDPASGNYPSIPSVIATLTQVS